METSTIHRSLVTAAPYLRSKSLMKRDGNTCGDLQGRYPNVQAPICSGSISICTFDGSLQGCCDDQDRCQLYTTCIGRYSPETCVGSLCLPCSNEAPYCVKYNFWDTSSQRAYDGYSCADFQATQTIWGIATSILAQTTTSSSSTAAAVITTSSSSSPESTQTPVLTRFNTTMSTSSTSESSATSNSSIASYSSTFRSSVKPSTTSNPLSTATSSLSTTPVRSVSHTAAIAGGVVGGLALLVLIVVGVCCFQRKRLPSGGRQTEVQQVYR